MIKLLLLGLIFTTIVLIYCTDLLVTALLLALLYLLLIWLFVICGLEFLALATFLIYLGAVVVLFIFVLMMLQTGYLHIQSMFFESYLNELIIIVMSVLLALIYDFVGSYIFLTESLQINSLVFFDILEIQTTFLVDFGFLLYQVFYIGTLWLAVLLTITLCGLLLLLSYRKPTNLK